MTTEDGLGGNSCPRARRLKQGGAEEEVLEVLEVLEEIVGGVDGIVGGANNLWLQRGYQPKMTQTTVGVGILQETFVGAELLWSGCWVLVLAEPPCMGSPLLC